MADRPSIKDILAKARAGGAASPGGEPISQSEREAGPTEPEPTSDEPMELSSAPEPAPTAESLGRPLTLKEKLAAARTGAAPTPAAKPAAAKAAPKEVEVPAAEEAAPAPRPAIPTDRPLTLKEKLAAARTGAAPAAPSAGKPAAAKPAAGAKPAAPAAAKAATRDLPPLDKITDPRDLAEALRRAGTEKEKAAKADAATRAASAAGATPAGAKAAATKKVESKVIPPKPSKDAATAPSPSATATAPAVHRRQFFGDASWVIAGWGAFTAGMTALTLGCVRFLFPNVLAEPPSTIKVGLPTDFEKEQVNERWKAEWGFWIVRSSAYDGEDKIYAIQSVCTHLGCPPNWLSAETKFKCPCHGSGFYISGVNFEGPAPRPLERFKVALNDGGEIVVDKSQKYQEELKQWGDPDSFIIA